MELIRPLPEKIKDWEESSREAPSRLPGTCAWLRSRGMYKKRMNLLELQGEKCNCQQETPQSLVVTGDRAAS